MIEHLRRVDEREKKKELGDGMGKKNIMVGEDGGVVSWLIGLCSLFFFLFILLLHCSQKQSIQSM